MSKISQAAQVQKFLDWEFGIDIAAFQNSELARMATEINKFLALGVSTDDLVPADELESEEFADEQSDEDQDEFTDRLDRDDRDDY